MANRKETALNNNYGKHLSHSQISMFLRCPRQWCFRYVQKIRTPANANLILGRSYHSALEANFLAKVESGQDLETQVVLDAFDRAWNQKLQAEEIDWQDESPSETKDIGVALVGCYMATQAPFVMPAKVEERFSISQPELGDYSLDGVIDIITVEDVIIDHKTSGKAKNQGDVDSDLQPYAYAAAVLTDPALDECILEFQTAVKTKKPYIQVLRTVRNRNDVAWYMAACAQVIRQIDAGIFPPNPQGWHCDKRYCGYWDLCMEEVRSADKAAEPQINLGGKVDTVMP